MSDTWRRLINQTRKCLKEILRREKVITEWKEAEKIILHKKGDVKDYRLVSIVTHVYKMFTQILQRYMEKILAENQSKEQAHSWKGYSTVDHI